jgi:hypothetical protein
MHITTSTAALVLGADTKVIDNILAREGKHLIRDGRRGRTRRISFAVLKQLAVALELRRHLGVPIAIALDTSAKLLATADGEMPMGALGSIRIDLKSLGVNLSAALADAIEQTTPPPRGRPRKGDHE